MTKAQAAEINEAFGRRQQAFPRQSYCDHLQALRVVVHEHDWTRKLQDDGTHHLRCDVCEVEIVLPARKPWEE